MFIIVKRCQGGHIEKAHSFGAAKSTLAPTKNIMNRQIINIPMAKLEPTRKKKLAHGGTTYSPSGEEKSKQGYVYESLKGNINPNSSGCLASLSTPSQSAIHKSLGMERGAGPLLGPVPWRCPLCS